MGKRAVWAMVMTAGLFGISEAKSAERPRVDVACEPTNERLIYACTFHVVGRKSGEAIDDADFSVSADMPSMPMAHNVRPIAPERMAKPGAYHGKIHLEMMGEWALKMTFKKPVRDIVIEKMMFGETDTDAAKSDDHKHGHGSGHQSHAGDSKHKH